MSQGHHTVSLSFYITKPILFSVCSDYCNLKARGTAVSVFKQNSITVLPVFKWSKHSTVSTFQIKIITSETESLGFVVHLYQLNNNNDSGHHGSMNIEYKYNFNFFFASNYLLNLMWIYNYWMFTFLILM